jgi:hypothetical protein
MIEAQGFVNTFRMTRRGVLRDCFEPGKSHVDSKVVECEDEMSVKSRGKREASLISIVYDRTREAVILMVCMMIGFGAKTHSKRLESEKKKKMS